MKNQFLFPISGGLPNLHSPLAGAGFPDIDADEEQDDGDTVYSANVAMVDSRRTSRGGESVAVVDANDVEDGSAVTNAGNGGPGGNGVDIKLIPPSGSESGSKNGKIDIFQNSTTKLCQILADFYNIYNVSHRLSYAMPVMAHNCVYL